MGKMGGDEWGKNRGLELSKTEKQEAKSLLERILVICLCRY